MMGSAVGMGLRVPPHHTWATASTVCRYAATKGCRLFISSSLVHAHVKSIFLPTTEADVAPAAAHADSLLATAGRILSLALLNAAWLPLLIAVHDSTVVDKASKQRLALHRGDRILWVAWLLPCGRAALRFASAFALALVLTVRVPSVAYVNGYDVALAVWALAIAESIATQVNPSLSSTRPHTQGHLACAHRYERETALWRVMEMSCHVPGLRQVWRGGRSLRIWLAGDGFNALDAATFLLLVGLAICTAYDVIADVVHPSAVGVALQAFGALVAWARLFEINYVFPKAGPQVRQNPRVEHRNPIPIPQALFNTTDRLTAVTATDRLLPAC